MSRAWTQREIDRLHHGVAQGESYRTIAEAIGRTASAVKTAALKRGLARRTRWTDRDVAFLRTHYKRATTVTLAACLRRSVQAVHEQALARGLSERKQSPLRDKHDEWRRLYDLGWSDAEIGSALGVTRESVRGHRERHKLPPAGRNDHYRARMAATTRRQVEAVGVKSLAEVRAKAFHEFASKSGWPSDLRPRAVQILNLLYDVGPMTRRQIAEGTGIPWKGSRKSLVSNDPEGSYLAHLVKRGLVVNLGRVVKGQGSGYSTCVYAIPPHVVRGDFSTFTKAAK